MINDRPVFRISLLGAAAASLLWAGAALAQPTATADTSAQVTTSAGDTAAEPDDIGQDAVTEENTAPADDAMGADSGKQAEGTAQDTEDKAGEATLPVGGAAIPAPQDVSAPESQAPEPSKNKRWWGRPY